MKKTNWEQKLVDDFIKNFVPTQIKNPISVLHSTVKYQSNPDLVFETNYSGVKYAFNLEVKSFISTNRSNNVLLIYGDILKNITNQVGSNIVHGAFLQYDSTKGVKSYFNKRLIKMNPYEWNKFGNDFNCFIIFFYDDITHELFYSAWQNFNGMVTKW